MSLPIRTLNITVSENLYHQLVESYRDCNDISFDTMLRRALKSYVSRNKPSYTGSLFRQVLGL